MPDTDKPVDKIPELAARLMKLGLEDKLIKAIGDNLAPNVIDETFELSQAAQQKAFEAATSKMDRKVMEFVESLLDELGETLEEEHGIKPDKPDPSQFSSRPNTRRRRDGRKERWGDNNPKPGPESSEGAKAAPAPIVIPPPPYLTP